MAHEPQHLKDGATLGLTKADFMLGEDVTAKLIKEA
jgi:hypothetical protein